MKKKHIFLDVAIVVFIIIIFLIVYKMIAVQRDYSIAKASYEIIKQESIIVDSSIPEERQINLSTIGECSWIYIPDTNIDYPVMQADDNTTYLQTDATGNVSSSGAIFLNCENNSNMTDLKTIIYGHNRKDGSMFHNLRYYDEEDYGKSHPYVYLYMDNQCVLKYQLLCVSEVDPYDEIVYLVRTNEEIETVTAHLLKNSTVVYADPVQTNLLILSTCKKDGVRRVVAFQQVQQ